MLYMRRQASMCTFPLLAAHPQPQTAPSYSSLYGRLYAVCGAASSAVQVSKTDKALLSLYRTMDSWKFASKNVG